MRHFIRKITFSGPVTALAFGMLNASTTAGLVALTGLAGFAAPGRPRTVVGAVNLAAITAPTDDH